MIAIGNDHRLVAFGLLGSKLLTFAFERPHAVKQ
jgi:hypothetical protein